MINREKSAHGNKKRKLYYLRYVFDPSSGRKTVYVVDTNKEIPKNGNKPVLTK